MLKAFIEARGVYKNYQLFVEHFANGTDRVCFFKELEELMSEDRTILLFSDINEFKEWERDFNDCGCKYTKEELQDIFKDKGNHEHICALSTDDGYYLAMTIDTAIREYVTDREYDIYTYNEMLERFEEIEKRAVNLEDEVKRIECISIALPDEVYSVEVQNGVLIVKQEDEQIFIIEKSYNGKYQAINTIGGNHLEQTSTLDESLKNIQDGYKFYLTENELAKARQANL